MPCLASDARTFSLLDLDLFGKDDVEGFEEPVDFEVDFDFPD